MKSPLAFLIYFSVVVLNLVSCNKQGDTGQPIQGKDSLIAVKANLTEADTLQSIYKTTNGLNHYLYGKRRADGRITHVSSMAIQQKGQTDSTLNVLFDDSLRVSHYYFVINGRQDSSLLSFSYSADSIRIVDYRIDWTTGVRTAKYQVKVKKTGQNSYTSLGGTIYRMHGSIWDDPDALAFAVGAHVAGASATGIISGILLGLAAAGTAPFSISAAVIGFIGGAVIYALAPSDAAASELSSTPIGSPYNPRSLFSQLKTIKDILVAHPWKYQTKIRDGANDLRPCDADDIWTFNTATIVFNRGGNLCGPNQLVSATSSWLLNNNDQSLRIFSGAGEFYNMDLVSLTLNRLEIRGFDDLGINWRFVLVAP